jgi:hypothetical protein
LIRQKDFSTGDYSRSLTFSFARKMKYWEIIADKLSASGWSWGYSSHIDLSGRVLFTADAHRSDGKRVIVRAAEKLTAFLELEKRQTRIIPLPKC